MRWNKTPWICDACGIAYGNLEKETANGLCTAFVPDYHGERVCGGKTFHRARVFLGSLMDIFDQEVPIEHFINAMEAVRQCRNLDFLLTTKRPQLWKRRLNDSLDKLAKVTQGTWLKPDIQVWMKEWLLGKAPANVWMITSTEDQKWFDQRIEHLLKIPAAVHALSAEPLLGPIDLDIVENGADGPEEKSFAKPTKTGMLLDWVIVGGESGPGARPCNIEWLRGIQAQCKAAGVAFFCKQLGSDPRRNGQLVNGTKLANVPMLQPLKDKKGGDINEFPEDLRVRQWPEGVAR